MICLLFLIVFWLQNRPQIDQKSIQKAIRNKIRFGMDFRERLDRFGSDFRPKLGAKLGQVGTKIERIGTPRRHQKIIKNQFSQGAATSRR